MNCINKAITILNESNMNIKYIHGDIRSYKNQFNLLMDELNDYSTKTFTDPIYKGEFNDLEFNKKMYDKLIKKFNSPYIYLAKDNDKYIGMCTIGINKHKIGVVNYFYVNPKYQHKGIGSTLLKKSLHHMKHIYKVKTIELSTLGVDDKLVNMYKKHKFKPFFLTMRQTV